MMSNRGSLSGKSHITIFFIIQLILLSFIPVITSGISTEPPTRTENSAWEAQRLWTDTEELYALAVGDVDLSHPGDEIVVGGNSNKVTVLYGFGNSWVEETIFKDSWYVTSLAIGDVYPNNPGNEIVVVGWSTYVTLVYKSVETNKWVSERLYHDTDWLYDVAIGDLDPMHPGNEIVWSGDPRILRMLSYSEENQSWVSKNLWGSPSNLMPADINVITIGDFDSAHPGNECAVAGVLVNKINLTEVFYNYSSGKWSVHDMGKLEKDPLEMVVGDFYSGHEGNEIALVSIQRSVMMVYEGGATNGNAWVMEPIWQDIESIRDVEIADIIPTHAGNELIVAGYSDSASILLEDPEAATGWRREVIYASDSNLNGVAAGDFNAFHRGLELAIVQGGKVLNVQSSVTRFNLFTPYSVYQVPAGSSISVPVIISSEGGFQETVDISLNNAIELSGEGITVDISLVHQEAPTLAEVKFTISQTTPPGDFNVTLIGSTTSSGDSDKVTLNFTLEVLPKDTPAFNLTLLSKTGSVVADFSKSFGIDVQEINGWKDQVLLNIRYLPMGMSYSIEQPTNQPPDSKLTITTTSATPHERFFLIINGKAASGSSYQYSTVLVLDVLPPEPEYKLDISPKEVYLPLNGSTELTVFGFSYFGFDELLNFTISGLPQGVTAKLQPESFIPTGNSTIILFSKNDLELKKYNITLIANSTGSGLQHEAFFDLVLKPEAPKFNIALQGSEAISVNTDQVANINIIITPVAGFSENVTITITGLKDTMTWNSEISPITITELTNVQLNITGLDKPGPHDLSIIVSSENITNDLDITLKVLPEVKSNDDPDFDPTLTYLLIIIIIIIIILLILSRIKVPASDKQKKIKK